MAGVPGAAVVLTADQILMAQHRLLLDGMLASSQTTTSPEPLLRGLLLPSAPHDPSTGRAILAPLGLRRVEAALRRDGLGQADVAVADERHLTHVIGPETRVVALATGDPLGLGMSSSTMTAVAGGRIWTEMLFRRVLARVRATVRAAGSPAKIVVGGPGAWQLAQQPDRMGPLGIDHVICDYCEANVTDLVRQVMSGVLLPPVLQGEPPKVSDIPPIVGPATMGAVELSRGCGLGCDFCTLAGVAMGHLSPDTILADAETNLAGGNANLALLSEDFLRYGAEGVRCRPDALLELIRQLRSLRGVRLLQVDHVNVASVGQFGTGELRTLHDLLAGDQRGLCWVNIGVESASGRLVAALGCRPKMGGVAPEDWAVFAREQLSRLCATRFLPLTSLVIGVPGETTEDLRLTLDWVRSLRDLRLTVFPVLYAPVDGSPSPAPQSLSKLHWELLRECYALNFRHMPALYWDNQTRGGVPRSKCLGFQLLGKGQIAQWKTLLWWRQWRAPA